MVYDIYADGACSGNGMPFAIGGWSYVVCEKGSDTVIGEFYGKLRIGPQNSNRAELEAIIQALTFADSNPNDSYNIYTDCVLVENGIKGLCSKKGNRDLWTEIEYLCLKNCRYANRINVYHIKQDKKNKDDSNIKIVMNNRSDKLAKIASNNLLIKPVEPIGTIDEVQEKINKILLKERKTMNE